MSAEIHVGDIGLAFRVTIKDQDSTIVDLSTATTKEIIFKKPDGTIVTKTATFYTDGTDGIIQYTSVSGFLDTSGLWQLQGHVTLSGGEWKTDIQEFRVHKNLE